MSGAKSTVNNILACMTIEFYCLPGDGKVE